jgi:outer membrane protein insertion porin family
MKGLLARRTWVMVFALSAWCARGASAQDLDRFVGRVVSEVRVVSTGQPVRDLQLPGLVEVRAGEALRMDAVRKTIVRAMGLGRYLDVRVSAAEDGTAVRVEIDLVPLRTERRVVFAGDPGVAEPLLRRTVADRFGPAPAQGRAVEIARVLEELLKDEGYLRATVRSRDPGRGDAADDLVFDVACGARARIGAVTFRPPEGDDVRELREQLTILPGTVFNRAALRRQIEAATDAWRARSYLEARADTAVEESSNGAAVDLTITVARGPLVSLEFTGDPLPPKQAAELVPVVREASVDEDLLEDSRVRIVEHLRGLGYWDARSEFQRVAAADRLRIVFSVKNGPLYRVADVMLEGTSLVTPGELRPALRTAIGQPLLQAGLDADVQTLIADYRRRGFGDVTCRAAVEPVPGRRTDREAPVVVILRISEGARTLVSGVEVTGNTAVAAADLQPALETRVGTPLVAPTIEGDRNRILERYLNLGYRTAQVESAVAYTADRSEASVRFAVREGPRIIVDRVLVTGNDRISEATIRHEIVLEPGRPLGLDAINESQRRLSALGLFRRVTISELEQGDEDRRDVLVTVEESPATTLGYGVGVEFQKVETSEFAPRGFLELGRRNLWGRNRSVNLFSRVSLRRRSDSATTTSTADSAGGSQTAVEYRAYATYREPRVLRRSADLQIAAGLEQGSRTSFSFRHRSVRVNLSHRIGPAWTVLGQYSIQQNNIFEDRIDPADRPLIDRLFPQVRIGSVSASAVRNTRDDIFDPGSGSLIGLNGELALRPLGSQVGFAKTFLQGFIYRQLPTKRRIVAAGGVRLGLSTGFARDVQLKDENGDPLVGADGQPVTVRVRDLPASERFFAGGDTTVRGFQLDRVGRPDTFDSDGTPKGGHAELILNGEIRVALWKDLGVVGFVDAGNVFGLVNDFNLGQLRSGAGFGIRYKSPVGPLRLDVGFKLGTLRTFGTAHESRRALHISIGQAF